MGARTYHIAITTWAAMALAALLLPVSSLAQAPLKEAVLDVSINTEASGESLVVLRDTANGLWISAGDFTRLHLKAPQGQAVESNGKKYYPLNTLAGASVVIDEALQHATVQLPPTAFEPTLVHRSIDTHTRLAGVEPGAFFNYQLSGQRIEDTSSAGLLSELGLFGSPGVLTNSMVGRTGAGATEAVRLDTTFTHDFPDRLQSLVVGDTISTPGDWGNAVRFAGLHWGRNFGIRPDLLTAPMLSVGGEAVVPSTAEVFVNGQRVSSQAVPPGPFVIDQLPAISGSGDVRLVVRDAAGNVQTVTQPFYSGASLLAKGLSEYAVDVGAVREDYTLSSFHYGEALATGTYRYGLTNSLTLEAHGEAQMHDAHAVGFDLAVSTGSWGIASVTLAQGGNDAGSGVLTGVGFEHRGRILSFVLNTEFASDGYRQVGDTAFSNSPITQRSLAQIGANLGRAGSLAVAWASQHFQSEPSQQVVSLSYNVPIANHGFFGITASHISGDQPNNSIYANYTIALDSRRSFSTDEISTRQGGAADDRLLATVTQTAPVGPGNGWRLSAATSGDYDASWEHRNEALDLQVEAARNLGIAGERAFLTGALTWLDHDVSAARSVTQSFAVVDVGGIPNVPVYIDNQLMARTDENGRAVLHDLRAYEVNRISVDPDDLPLDTRLTDDRISVRPPYRSGVVARIPVTKVRAGTFRLVLPDGKPVPAGALVDFNGGHFNVVLDGLTYVDTLDHGTQGVAHWDGMRCRFRVAPPPPGDPLPDMGTVGCTPDGSDDAGSH